MGWFSRSRRRPPARTSRPCRLGCERLEDRTLLSTFQVVPAGTGDNLTKFENLTAALNAAQDGDTIQIEPGSAPGAGTVSHNRLTIQGDPVSSPAALPTISSLTVNPGIMATTLSNLNLGQVLLGQTSSHTQVANSLVSQIQEINGTGPTGGNVIQGNTVTGTVNLFGNTAAAAADQVLNNTFTGTADGTPYLFLQNDDGAVVQGNTFTSPGNGSAGVEVFDSQGVQVANNVMHLGPNSFGVTIESPGRAANAAVTGNRIDTVGQGVGILARKNTTGFNTAVSVAGNDLTGNRIGLEVQGDGTQLGTTDAGGGGGSGGGNNFAGFGTTADGRAAIYTLDAAAGTVSALGNVWSTGHPQIALYATPGTTVTTTDLPGNNQDYVRALYRDFLGRDGSDAEVQGWANAVTSIGPTPVASAIMHSTEALARLVGRLYEDVLGREADPAGGANWVTLLQNGGSVEQVLTGLLASPEFWNRYAGQGATPQAGFLQGLYQTVLGRAPGATEVAAWSGVVSAQGPGAVAAKFVASTEFRAQQVGTFYVWLHRGVAPSQAEVLGWVNSGMDLLTMQLRFTTSLEFYYHG